MTASEEQIGEVETGHEQDNRRHDHQEQGERRSDRATTGTRKEQEARRGRHLEGVPGVYRRKCPLESSGHGGECRRDSLGRGASSAPSDQAQRVRVARAECGSGRRGVHVDRLVDTDRQPHSWSGDARPRHSVRGDADHRERLAVNPHGSTDDARVGATLLPQRKADDRDTDISSGPFFFDCERASKSQGAFEDREVVGRHAGRQRPPRAVAHVEAHEGC
jgi:hypothetical protein